jgi:hypothetical protein
LLYDRTDLSLWAYGRELIRRTQFTSQGTAVLWLALDEKVRTRLSAESIWKARERLVQWAQTKRAEAGGQKE